MKTHVIGWACAATIAAGCQSTSTNSMAGLFTRKSNEVASAPPKEPAGLPKPTQHDPPQPQSAKPLFATGETALQRYYELDKQYERDHRPEARQQALAALETARLQFEAAIKADPGYAAAQHRLAIVSDLQENYRVAESHYLLALSLDPRNANVAADLGYSYLLQKNWMAAEQYLTQALTLDPNHDMAVEHLAVVYGERGQPQLAEATLMRTMSREKAQAKLAELFPEKAKQLAREAIPASSQRESLATNDPSRLPQAFPPQSPLGSQAQIPNGQLRPQLDQQPQRQQWPTNADGSLAQGQMLRDQLSQVDHAGQSSAGPIVIGREPAQNNIAAQQPQHDSVRGGQLPPNTPAAVANSGALQLTAPNPQDSQLNGSGAPSLPQTNRGLAQIYAGNRSIDPTGRRAAPQDPFANQSGQTRQAPASPYYEATPASGLAPSGEGTVPADFSSAHPLNQDNSAAALAGNPLANNPQVVQPQGNTIADARRAAAMMGLGLGPGQMFSSLEQPAPRLSPGVNSNWNGMNVATPPRQLPDLQPVPDLKQAPSFFEPSQATPNNSLGQQMPSAGPNLSAPNNWPTAGNPNQTPASQQPNNLQPADSGMNQPAAYNQLQSYDATRQQVDQTLQQTMNNTWGNRPSQAIPSPSAGVSYQQPDTPSQQMEAWNRQPMVPPPYAPQQGQSSAQATSNYAPQAAGSGLPVINPTAGRMMTGDRPATGPAVQRPNPLPAYRGNIVVPPAYDSAR
jgi:tetratricopeptide (TPR) repeat protein